MASRTESPTHVTRMERVTRPAPSPAPEEPLVARGQSYEAGAARLQPPDAPDTHRPGRELMRNLSVASALVLCVVALRAGAVPGAEGAVDAVLTAASGDSLLDDQLGRLSFVSAMFPEAALVFGESADSVLALPVSGGEVTHAWSRQEPYVTWETDAQQVTAALTGEVRGVYHGDGEELLVLLSGDGGLSCVYGNLGTCAVSAGDAVQRGDVIGTLLPGAALSFEARQDGWSVDPLTLLPALP